MSPRHFLHQSKRVAVVAALAVSLCGVAAHADPFGKTFIQDHCSDCHADGMKKGGFTFDKLGTDLTDAETMRRWVLVHDRVAKGEMPPKKEPRPAKAEQAAFLASLTDTLTKADDAQREVVLRRLNRTEYENTIRDLLGVNVELKGMLPEEVSAHGFDNVGEALATSEALIQGYLEAADAAIDAALGPAKQPEHIALRYPLSKDATNAMFRQTDAGVVLFSTGYCPSTVRQLRIRHDEKLTYRVRIHARAFQSDTPVVMSVHAGDVIVHRRPFFLVGYWDLKPGDMNVVEFTVRLGKGDTLHPMPYGTIGRPKDANTYDGPGIEIGDVEVEGPLEAWPPPSRAALLGDVDPAKGTLDDAKRIVARLLPRAFRRDTKPDEVEPYAALMKAALDDGRPFLDAVRLGVKAVLVSPEFLFLDEPTRTKAAKASGAEIDDFAVASRLSYFLWSSMPDAALLDAARSGRLREPGAMAAQVERMLKDAKAAAFVENFVGQWLDQRNIDFTEPDKKLYPEFDEALKEAMLGETRAYFARMLREDRSVLEFIDSDWTVVNERLAQLYGIDGVTGTTLRVVDLPKDSLRGGVLTQASVLKVTANGTNTSPVLRGVWVLDNILGEPAPPPPPGIPAVEPDIRGATTLRQQLDQHRNSERCATCHAKIDPPGFALESFDPIGGYRTWYRSLGEGEKLDVYANEAARHAHVRVAYRKGLPVDCTGELPGSGPFEGIRDLKAMLMKQPDRITRCVTRKLMVYALGRGDGFSDRPEIERIVAANAAQGHGLRTLVHQIVESPTFRQP
ncbi:MAG: DUF1592 domain-containing protein [Phycisphaera sp.]|nr:DUF1592 domain-containing protein [Phycisphaera sp.]